MEQKREVKHHNLKTIAPYFQYVWEGSKTFEARINDRDFQKGDTVTLEEYNPGTKEYTGRILHRSIGYVLIGGQFGVQEGYCLFSLIDNY